MGVCVESIDSFLCWHCRLLGPPNSAPSEQLSHVARCGRVGLAYPGCILRGRQGDCPTPGAQREDAFTQGSNQSCFCGRTHRSPVSGGLWMHKCKKSYVVLNRFFAFNPHVCDGVFRLVLLLSEQTGLKSESTARDPPAEVERKPPRTRAPSVPCVRACGRLPTVWRAAAAAFCSPPPRSELHGRERERLSAPQPPSRSGLGTGGARARARRAARRTNRATTSEEEPQVRLTRFKRGP